MPNLKLKSSDDEIIIVDAKLAKFSGTVKAILEQMGADDDYEGVVPLPKISSPILKKVIEWLSYHQDALPFREEDENNLRAEVVITPWDEEFLKMEQGTLFELIMGANYLNIKDLLELTCKNVANMMKGKTPEEIRTTFNINPRYAW